MIFLNGSTMKLLCGYYTTKIILDKGWIQDIIKEDKSKK